MFSLHGNNFAIQFHNFIFKVINNNLLHCFHGSVVTKDLNLFTLPLVLFLEILNLPVFGLDLDLVLAGCIFPFSTSFDMLLLFSFQLLDLFSLVFDSSCELSLSLWLNCLLYLDHRLPNGRVPISMQGILQILRPIRSSGTGTQGFQMCTSIIATSRFTTISTADHSLRDSNT